MKRVFVFLILCALSLGAAGDAIATAQDDTESPLFRMLNLVPSAAANDSDLILYADTRAIVDARPGAYWPADMAEFARGESSDDPRQPALMAALYGVAAGMDQLMMTLIAEGTREAVGFDFFSVHRTLEFGQRLSRSQGNVLEGDFDPAAIGAALAARGFAEQPTDGVEGSLLWCSLAGCEAGMQAAARVFGDPLGGQMGRKQPLVFVPPGTLLSSPSHDVLQAMLAARRAPDEDSILSLPEYRAAAEAITSRGVLLQAMFFPPDVQFDGPVSEGGVPRYALGVMAHVRDSEDVLTLVGLVYPDDASATDGAEALLTRFREARSRLFSDTPFVDLAAERGGAYAKGETYVNPASGYAVALIEFRSPVEPPEPVPNADGPGPIESGRIFQLLHAHFYNRALPWVAPMD